MQFILSFKSIKMRLSLLVPFFLPGVNGQLNTLAKAAVSLH